MEWSIQDLARAAGTTSRTLRHYDALGLLRPSRTGSNGYRHYDQDALLRLQRILLLRELGLGLTAIAEVLDGQQDAGAALRTHLGLLEQERQRLGRQIESVRTTLRKTARGEQLMASEAFDGFDHTRYEEEVTERWGAEAYRSGDRWWRSLTEAERQSFQQRHVDIARDFGAAHRLGASAGSPQVQEVTQRLHDWVATTTSVSADHFAGLGEMYVDDPRFGQHYDQHAPGTAVLVREAMRVYADRNLSGV